MPSSSLGWHPNNDMIVARGPGGQTEPATAAYSREFVLAVWGDLVVASRNSRYEIRAFHADGALGFANTTSRRRNDRHRCGPCSTRKDGCWGLSRRRRN